MISLTQYFEEDFVILKILNSGIILKNFTHDSQDGPLYILRGYRL